MNRSGRSAYWSPIFSASKITFCWIDTTGPQTGRRYSVPHVYSLAYWHSNNSANPVHLINCAALGRTWPFCLQTVCTPWQHRLAGMAAYFLQRNGWGISTRPLNGNVNLISAKMAQMWQMMLIVWILIKYILLLKIFSGSSAIFNWKKYLKNSEIGSKIMFCLIIQSFYPYLIVFVMVLYLFEVFYSKNEKKSKFFFLIFNSLGNLLFRCKSDTKIVNFLSLLHSTYR